MSFPRAELAHRSFRWRAIDWIAQRFAPPNALTTSSGFNAASYWSLTGALAAGFVFGLYWLLVSGDLWHVDFTLTAGWAILATFGVIFWFWPFLASYYLYSALSRFLSGRLRAAAYGALWHAAAHCALLDGLGSNEVGSTIYVPLIVGALWGSWLPAAIAPAERH